MTTALISGRASSSTPRWRLATVGFALLCLTPTTARAADVDLLKGVLTPIPCHLLTHEETVAFPRYLFDRSADPSQRSHDITYDAGIRYDLLPADARPLEDQLEGDDHSGSRLAGAHSKVILQPYYDDPEVGGPDPDAWIIWKVFPQQKRVSIPTRDVLARGSKTRMPVLRDRSSSTVRIVPNGQTYFRYRLLFDQDPVQWPDVGPEQSPYVARVSVTTTGRWVQGTYVWEQCVPVDVLSPAQAADRSREYAEAHTDSRVVDANAIPQLIYQGDNTVVGYGISQLASSYRSHAEVWRGVEKRRTWADFRYQVVKATAGYVGTVGTMAADAAKGLVSLAADLVAPTAWRAWSHCGQTDMPHCLSGLVVGASVDVTTTLVVGALMTGGVAVGAKVFRRAIVKGAANSERLAKLVLVGGPASRRWSKDRMRAFVRSKVGNEAGSLLDDAPKIYALNRVNVHGNRRLNLQNLSDDAIDSAKVADIDGACGAARVGTGSDLSCVVPKRVQLDRLIDDAELDRAIATKKIEVDGPFDTELRSLTPEEVAFYQAHGGDFLSETTHFFSDLATGMTPERAHERLLRLVERLRETGSRIDTIRVSDPLIVDLADLHQLVASYGDQGQALTVRVHELHDAAQAVADARWGYVDLDKTLYVGGPLNVRDIDGIIRPISECDLADPAIRRLVAVHNRKFSEETVHVFQDQLTHQLTEERRALEGWFYVLGEDSTWQPRPGALDHIRQFSHHPNHVDEYGDSFLNDVMFPQGVKGSAPTSRRSMDEVEVDPFVLLARAAEESSDEALADVARLNVRNYFSRLLVAIMKHGEGKSYLGLQGADLKSFILEQMHYFRLSPDGVVARTANINDGVAPVLWSKVEELVPYTYTWSDAT